MHFDDDGLKFNKDSVRWFSNVKCLNDVVVRQDDSTKGQVSVQVIQSHSLQRAAAVRLARRSGGGLRPRRRRPPGCMPEQRPSHDDNQLDSLATCYFNLLHQQPTVGHAYIHCSMSKITSLWLRRDLYTMMGSSFEISIYSWFFNIDLNFWTNKFQWKENPQS